MTPDPRGPTGPGAGPGEPEASVIRRLLDENRLEALRRAEAFAAARPGDADAQLLHAAALSILQDYPGAVAVLQPLWRLVPDATIGFNLGYCLRQTGDYAAALRQFLATLAIEDGVHARALAADTAAVLGEPALARRLLSGHTHPVLAFRARTLGAAGSSFPAQPEAADHAVLFWMKYDCHLYGRLDHKATLARLLPRASPYWPETYALPAEAEAARAAVVRGGTGRWIAKPATESGGRGMTLIEGPAAELPPITGVLQRLVDPPFLHAGRKLNIRLLLALSGPTPAQAALWRSGLAYLAIEPYAAPAGPATAGAVANLLRAPREALARPVGSLPAHVVPLEELIARLPPLAGLDRAVVSLATCLVEDLEQAGFWASVRHISDAFAPRFLGLDVGLDAEARPWLFEIERYPGLGGVSPVTAAVNARFRRDWCAYALGVRGAEAAFVSLAHA